jgi:hypothetical protein
VATECAERLHEGLRSNAFILVRCPDRRRHNPRIESEQLLLVGRPKPIIMGYHLTVTHIFFDLSRKA